MNLGRCSGCHTTLRSPAASVTCPRGCRTPVALHPVKHVRKGRLTKCGAACQRGTGRMCDCECGGANHGKRSAYYVHGNAVVPKLPADPARVEMTCIELPDEPTDEEIARTNRTRAERKRAYTIAARLGVRIATPEHEAHGVLHGDGYVYPRLGILEEVLDAFDKARVGYDNVDLPRGAPADLIVRLQQRYAGSIPRVHVNLNYGGMDRNHADDERTGDWRDIVTGSEYVDRDVLNKHQMPDIVARLLASGARPPFEYVGAGMTGVVLCSGPRAFKIARHKSPTMHSWFEAEAEFFRAASRVPGVREHVAKFIGFDPTNLVIARACIVRDPDVPSWKVDRWKLHWEIERLMIPRGWTAPEYKDDSYVLTARGPILVDGTMAHRVGKVLLQYAKDLLEGRRPWWSETPRDLGFALRMEVGKTLTQDQIAPLEARLASRAAHGDETVGKDEKVPPDVAEAFTALGHAQRGDPEAAMGRVQRAMGGGVMNYAVEHVGDLTHRMSHMAGWWEGHGNDGYAYVLDKVKACLRLLRNKYGFEREARENFANNARHRGISLDEYMAEVNAALAKYVAEHRKLPVYNRAQWLARQAAIDLGQMKIRDATWDLSALEHLLETPEKWRAAAFEYQRDAKGRLLQFPYDKPYAWVSGDARRSVAVATSVPETNEATLAKAREGLSWYFKRYGVNEARFVMARYRFHLAKTRTYWSQTTFEWEIEPVGGTLETSEYGSKSKRYRVPRAGQLDRVPPDPVLGYRGMAWEEWQSIRRTGRIASLYAHNIGEEQSGLTFFGDAETASTYAGGFAPLSYLPALRRPGVVIAVPRELLLDHKDRPGAIPAGELAVAGPLPASAIRGVWYLIPDHIRYGRLDLVLDRDRWKDGSRHNPSVYTVIVAAKTPHAHGNAARQRRFVFYATQYGIFWRLTEPQLRQVLERGARGEQYNLDNIGKRVKRKPAWAPHVVVFKMLDWEGQYQTTLDELDSPDPSTTSARFSHAGGVWRM